MRQNKYEYDAFISHAVEDKIPIANELCAKLERAGLKIWYSGKELGIGDSIEKTIEKGLNRSRYGIVIFSPTYLAKNWTIREFYTLLAKEIEEQKVILPVLYNITLDDLKNKDLLMADRFAVNADRGIDFVVERLVREIRKPKPVKEKVAWFSRIWLLLILSMLTNVGLLVKSGVSSEPRQLQSEVSVDHSESQLMTPTIFREMEGLVNRLGTCSCDHASPSAFPKTQMAVNKQRDSPGLQDPRGQRTSYAKNGNKMTMAVVFQIETPAQAQQPVEGQMDEMIETFNAPDEFQPFMTVSNREIQPNRSHEGCLHARQETE